MSKNKVFVVRSQPTIVKSPTNENTKWTSIFCLHSLSHPIIPLPPNVTSFCCQNEPNLVNTDVNSSASLPPLRHWYLPRLLDFRWSSLSLVQCGLLGAAHTRGPPLSSLRAFAQHLLWPTSGHGPLPGPAPRQRLPQPPGRPGQPQHIWTERTSQPRRWRGQQQQQCATDSQ